MKLTPIALYRRPLWVPNTSKTIKLVVYVTDQGAARLKECGSLEELSLGMRFVGLPFIIHGETILKSNIGREGSDRTFLHYYSSSSEARSGSGMVDNQIVLVK
jgi:hypothetical protein